MIEPLLRRALTALVRTGDLHVVTASGTALRFGDGTGEPVSIRFLDWRAQAAFLLDPDLRLGELFTDARLVVEQGTIFDLLGLLLRHARDIDPGWSARRLDAARGWIAARSRNDPRRSRRNVAHHYDLDDRLYALFLDSDWQYSCAYFEREGQTLDDAQLAKKRHVAAKLQLRPGDRILDIGSGWGGLACYLAETGGAGHVTGISLSEHQIAAARANAAKRGLSDRVTFRLQDYRELQGTFDRIVSVGMFEHVGARQYRAYFETCRQLLADDGVMLLHTIGSSEPPSLTNPWITRYIFPGGHLPSLSTLAAEIERSGLVVTDIEVLRLHYADTLRAWRTNFLARRAEAARLYDERFCRMWEYYLSMAEAAFRYDDAVVFQVQLARRAGAVARTREPIAEAERVLRARERSRPNLAQAS